MRRSILELRWPRAKQILRATPGYSNLPSSYAAAAVCQSVSRWGSFGEITCGRNNCCSTRVCPHDGIDLVTGNETNRLGHSSTSTPPRK